MGRSTSDLRHRRGASQQPGIVVGQDRCVAIAPRQGEAGVAHEGLVEVIQAVAANGRARVGGGRLRAAMPPRQKGTML